MGIKSLSTFLRKKYPEIFEEVHLSSYRYKKVAIDISNHLCRLKASCGEDRWLSALIGMIACLRRYDIHCVFVYDTGAPPEKDDEKKKRIAEREKRDSTLFALEEALEEYHRTQTISQILIDYYNEKVNKKSSGKSTRRLLGKPRDGIDMNFVERCIRTARSQIFHVSKADFALTKKLFDVLKIPYFDAPLEAETLAADMCKTGLVDGVLSEDTDILAYGAPKMLTKLSTVSNSCIQLKHADILNNMGLDYKEFVDFCIMCGTDYNNNIPGIGPGKAYKHITTHGSIENIARETRIDITPLKHERGRELFLQYEKMEIRVPHCGVPDFRQVELFLARNNLRTCVKSLSDALTKSSVEIEFADDDEDLEV